jgi:hypothetical protein
MVAIYSRFISRVLKESGCKTGEIFLFLVREYFHIRISFGEATINLMICVRIPILELPVKIIRIDRIADCFSQITFNFIPGGKHSLL